MRILIKTVVVIMVMCVFKPVMASENVEVKRVINEKC